MPYGPVAQCWVSTVYSVGAPKDFRMDPKGDLFLLLQGSQVLVTDPMGRPLSLSASVTST